MRPQVLKVRLGNAIVTIVDNGRNVVQTARVLKNEILEK